MFVVLSNEGRVLQSFPAERLDFDPANIPDRIQDSFGEALTCHAEGCFIAAAIMVRRTLEEVCDDRGAAGDNLKKRIVSLKDRVTLPVELFNAMEGLRLLGNDVAHLKA